MRESFDAYEGVATTCLGTSEHSMQWLTRDSIHGSNRVASWGILRRISALQRFEFFATALQWLLHILEGLQFAAAASCCWSALHVMLDGAVEAHEGLQSLLSVTTADRMVRYIRLVVCCCSST